MKKIFSYLLLFVSVLALVGCGDGNDTPETSEATTSTEIITISHPLVEEICGEWKTSTEGAPFKSLLINADGTCVVDGVDAVWQIENSYTRDDSLSVYIFVNGEAYCGILYFSNTGAITLTKPYGNGDMPLFLPYEAYKE